MTQVKEEKYKEVKEIMSKIRKKDQEITWDTMISSHLSEIITYNLPWKIRDGYLNNIWSIERILIRTLLVPHQMTFVKVLYKKVNIFKCYQKISIKKI